MAARLSPPPQPILQQAAETADGNGMAAQPGIDDIQLAHILPDIGKRDIIPVEQFFFVRANGKIHRGLL